MTASVGFIGAGAIGLPMLRRIAEGGFEVEAVELAPDRQALVRSGGIPVSADVAVCSRHEIVIVMVATPDQLIAALCGAGGAISHMKPGSSLVVMSTVGPEAVRRVQQDASAAAVELLDVPVSGGVAGAEAGRLKLFASGPPTTLSRCLPVMACLGEIVSCGPSVGSGQAVKLVNQLLCGVHLAVAAEALVYAEALGLDPAAVLKAVTGGAAGSWMLSDRGPRMLATDRVPVSSAVAIFEKDASLVAAAAREVGFKAPLLAAAADIFARARALGLSDLDDSQVIRVYRSGTVTASDPGVGC